MAFNRKYFKIFKYLLPKANAFTIFIQKKLTNLIEGLTAIPDDFRNYIDNIYFDIFPETTRSLELWEKQFGILCPSQDMDIRINTVDQRWKMKGGQGKDYIEAVLRDAGFDVYVHENNPPVDPAIFLVGDFIMVAGGYNAYAGRSDAFAGKTTTGELLVNGFIPIASDQRLFLANAGNGWAGNQLSIAGYFKEFKVEDKSYTVPTDPDEWPFLFFIGGPATRNSSHELTAIATAQVAVERETEFKKLILMIKAAQSWVGLVVEFIF